MSRRLMRGGHEVVAHDRSPDAVAALVKDGAAGANSLEELVQRCRSPRAICLMVPAGVVESALASLVPLLSANDIVIDGGNSHYHDDIERARSLSASGIHYIDMGTSGGVWGLERGYCLMIGGEREPVQRLDPIFRTLAPGASAAQAPGVAIRHRSRGYLHCGPAGAGHFVKMIHNGIEYGLMAAYAEGLNILRHANVGSSTAEHDAETTPLRTPRALSVRLQARRDCGSVASWQRDWLVAARPDRISACRRSIASRNSAAAFRIPVKAAGRCRRPTTRASPPTCSPPHCSSALRHAIRTCSRTRCCRRCVSDSAATRNRSRERDGREKRRAGPLRRNRRSGVQENLPCAAWRWRSAASFDVLVIGFAQAAVDDRATRAARARQRRGARRASMRRRSRRCRPGCATSTATINDAATFTKLARGAGRRAAARCTTSPFHRRCFRSSSPTWPLPSCLGNARIIVEKPFGRDLASARVAERRRCTRYLPEERDLPHRSLPRQGSGPEPAVLPLRQRAARAAVESPLRRERADHDGRILRRIGARRLLRRDRRDPRRDPEPPVPGAQLPGDGGAVGHRRRGRFATSRRRCFATSGRSSAERRRARPVPRLSR